MGTKATLSISAQAFTLDGDYEIRWSDSSSFTTGTYTVLATGTSPHGTYAVTRSFTIPESNYGVHYIQFMRLYRTDPVNVQFIVRSRMVVNPSSAKPGAHVSITGSGFPTKETGSVMFDNKNTVVKFTTNKLGSFTTTLVVPDTTAGVYTLTAESPKLYSSTTTSLEVLKDEEPVTPPPQQEEPAPEPTPTPKPEPAPDTMGDIICPPSPSPVTPMGQKFGAFGPQPVTFFWNPVSDKSVITYTLQIADNVAFSQIKPDHSVKGITQTSYTIMLEPGIYYWRVMATDGSGNESQWGNAPYGFSVSELSMMIDEFLSFWQSIL